MKAQISKSYFRKSMAFVAATAGTLVLLMGPAGAATTITPNPVPVTPGQTTVEVTVGWTQPLNKPLFFTQCFADASDPSFDYASSCSLFSEIPTNPDPIHNSGSIQFPAFRGLEPSGDKSWGCFAPGDVIPPGITSHTTCYIRVTNDGEANLTDQQFAAFTFVSSSPVVPEVPYAVLIPLVALAVFGGGIYLQRRRTATV